MPTASDDAVRRRELADFLRARRAQVQPEDVGLPRTARRRTPGLRREEVAARAGVGTTWYTWLEQARDVQASPSVLDGLAQALRLSDPEREHLHRLGRRSARPPVRRVEPVPPAVRRLVEQLGDNPACVIGGRWDFLVWNRAFQVVFTDPAALPEDRRNRLWWLFTDPDAQARAGDWEATTRQVVARFRQDCGHDLADPWVAELVDDLLAASSRFAELWRRHEVVGHGDGCKLTVHPIAGALTFEHAIFAHPASPNLRIVLYSPISEDDTAAKVRALLARA